MADRLSEVVEVVKAQAERVLPRSTVDLVLPVYDGAFAARFGVLDPDALETAHDRLTSSENVADNAQACCDFLADACRVICRRQPEGEATPLEHDDSTPVRFDSRFAESLGLSLAEENAAAVVRACWTTEDGTLSAMALDAFATRLLGWMQDTSRPVVGELLGESQGSRPSNGLVALSSTD